MDVDSPGATIRVEVAYATPERQAIVSIEVPQGCTVAEAIRRSAIREQFPGMVIDAKAVGIFGRKVSPERPLEEGDRVEIYRPLLADPKESRRRRAERDGAGSRR
jgi:putative ubiquitin-RnfH superfamily antitoxin RatB of RatAB toxin-antitoxin module